MHYSTIVNMIMAIIIIFNLYRTIVHVNVCKVTLGCPDIGTSATKKKDVVSFYIRQDSVRIQNHQSVPEIPSIQPNIIVRIPGVRFSGSDSSWQTQLHWNPSDHHSAVDHHWQDR